MKNRRKIALFTFVHPDLLPPVHQVARTYSDAGFDVDLISCGYSKSSNTIRKEASANFVFLDIYSGSFRRKLRLQYLYYSAVSKLSSANNYELVFTFCPTSFFYASIVFGASNVIINCLEIYNLNRFSFSFDYIVHRYFLWRINKSRSVFFPSKERALFLFNRYRLVKEPGVILNTPFVPKGFTITKKKIGERIKVLHTGGLNDSRGVLELLKGFALLAKDQYELNITNYGTDPYSAKVNDFILQYSLTNVRLMPQLSREDLISLQATCHIGICFIKHLGGLDTEFIAPNKLGEYLQYGLVCIVSDQQYFKLLGDNNFILQSDIRNPEFVAQSIRKAASVLDVEGTNDSIARFVNEFYSMRPQLLNHKLLPK